MGPGPALATMDAWFTSPAAAATTPTKFLWDFVFSQPAEAQKFVNAPTMPARVGPIPPFTNTKAYGKIKKGEETFYGHLFVITADVCETNAGDCKVSIDETLKHEVKIKSQPWKVRETVVRPTKTYTPSSSAASNIMIGVLAKPGRPECDKRIVIPDTPMRSQFLKVPLYLQATVDQVISIADSSDPNKKWWVGQRFAQGADSAGNQKFNWQSMKSTHGDSKECCEGK
jgi:hypothetical protein